MLEQKNMKIDHNRKGTCVESPKQTVDNIKELAERLATTGRTVFIATIPQQNQSQSDGIRLCNRERNTHLREFIDSLVPSIHLLPVTEL